MADRLRGAFIALEGADGSGKSTQIDRLLKHLASLGLCVCHVREPGGTAVGEQVRAVLLSTNNEMSPVCEMLLYMASRAQLVHERIAPALAQGHTVLADRFVSSTLAYQGAGAGLPERDILDVARVATSGYSPDLIVVFDVDATTAAQRTRGASPKSAKSAKSTAPGVTLFDDRIEQRGLDFQERVRRSYLDQAAREPARHLVVDARGTPDQVWGALCRGLHEWASARPPGHLPHPPRRP
ncbi:MAG: dTMP kinase [Phycisphaeraceae bacterium]|nr:MAG: dTMP kinase [Phycisphaeraceae bacterium]